MRTGKILCGKEPDGKYRHFYPSKGSLRLCGIQEKDVVEVCLEESPDGEYWGWWDNKKQEFSMIYGAKMLVEICSPCAFKKQIEDGEGDIVQIKVTEKQ